MGGSGKCKSSNDCNFSGTGIQKTLNYMLREKNTKIRPWRTPIESLPPWDHAQMIERKILFRIALTRALYDQIRP